MWESVFWFSSNSFSAKFITSGCVNSTCFSRLSPTPSGARGSVFAEALASANGSNPGRDRGDEVSAACYICLRLAGSLGHSINAPGWDGGGEDVMERVFNRTL